MCDVPGCKKKDLYLIYYGNPVCECCFEKYDSEEIKKRLGIPIPEVITGSPKNKPQQIVGDLLRFINVSNDTNVAKCSPK